jgi:uncharacterized membrane protein
MNGSPDESSQQFPSGAPRSSPAVLGYNHWDEPNRPKPGGHHPSGEVVWRAVVHYVALNLGWDMFLAVVPAVLGWILAAGLRRTRPVLRWLWLPLAVAWLAFLPNSPYLLTELRHFEIRPPDGLIAASMTDAGVKSFLARTAFIAGFTGSGLILFVLAVRPVARLLRSWRFPVAILAPPLFLANSVGVYLGLRVRLNSWDLASRPQAVVDAAVEALRQSTALGYILAFATFLWLAYLVVDIWFDGLALRWKEWTASDPAEADREQRASEPAQCEV